MSSVTPPERGARDHLVQIGRGLKGLVTDAVQGVRQSIDPNVQLGQILRAQYYVLLKSRRTEEQAKEMVLAGARVALEQALKQDEEARTKSASGSSDGK